MNLFRITKHAPTNKSMFFRLYQNNKDIKNFLLFERLAFRIYENPLNIQSDSQPNNANESNITRKVLNRVTMSNSASQT